MYLRRKLSKEGGFTLAEIFVAGLIMAVALIPIVRMFDTSFSGIRTFEQSMSSVDCAKAAMEEIRTIPFYEPHTDGNKDLSVEGNRYDIDDHFWGARSPINTTYYEGESVPDWENMPAEAEIQYYDYGEFAGHEGFRVTVQLCYLSDDTGVATLQGFGNGDTNDDWGPAKPGKDRPADVNNIPLHLLLVRVNAYWMKNDTEVSYSLESVITDTEALYNLGLNSITVDGPDAIKGTRENAAAHWSNPEELVDVTIKGYGFDPDTIEAFLVRDGRSDVTIVLNSKTSTVLTGSVNLYSGHGEAANPFDPRADVGYWSVKIRQEGLLSTYLYQGFVVEYPKPVIFEFGNDDGVWPANKSSLGALDVTLKVQGGPFVYLVDNPSVRLIQNVESNPEIIEGTVVSVTGVNNGYTSSPGCNITATFDVSASAPGEYFVEVTNVVPELIGHVNSDQDDRVYIVTEPPPPEVDAVYVFGTGTTSAYGNWGNPWDLMMEGRYFNTSATEMWLCSSVTAGEPSGNRVQGTEVIVPNTTSCIAKFDLSGLPYGMYYGYVKNTTTGNGGWTATPVFEVREFNANIGSFVPNSGYNFYENYYDIGCKINGNGFLSTSGVRIVDTTTGDEYNLAGSYTVNTDNEIGVNLNLIACDNTHDWAVRVYFGGAYVEKGFDIALGPAKILPANDDSTHYAVRIYRYWLDYYWYNIFTRRSRWIDAGWSNETTAIRAQAIRTETTSMGETETGMAYFEVKGMGFPMNDTTYLRVWRGDYSAPSWSQSGNFACTMDRANKVVKIASGSDRASSWTMPNATGDCGIEVRGSVGAANSYNTRWVLVNN